MRNPEAIKRAKDKFNAKQKALRIANPELDQAIKEKAKAYSKERYRRLKQDPGWAEANRAINNRWKQQRREEFRPYIDAFKAEGCLLCEETNPVCMHAHHIDPTQKEFIISAAADRCPNVQTLQIELAKCVCLCANCHLKLHAGLVSLPHAA